MPTHTKIVPLPRITSRPFQGDADWWRLRSLLVETVPLMPPCFNWDVRRLEGKRFYHPDPAHNSKWQSQVQLWETQDGRLVGAVNQEGHGDAHLQIHPEFRYLEEDMIAWAEETLAAPVDDGTGRVIEMVVYEYDATASACLSGAVGRRRRIGASPTACACDTGRWWSRRWPKATRCAPPIPKNLADCRQIAAILNAAFNRTFHNAEEYQTFARLAPCFHRNLDLVAVAPDGSFAAYVGIPYDDANRRGIFEPVCTHPDHRRKGLAQALMHEGLLRLKASARWTPPSTPATWRLPTPYTRRSALPRRTRGIHGGRWWRVDW